MEIKLYNNKSEINVINKTLELKETLEINLKKDFTLENPFLILNRNNVPETVDYIYIEYFKRYFFIYSKEVLNNQLIRLNLRCDVLESFKGDLMNCVVTVTKSDNMSYTDTNNLITDVRKKIVKHDTKNYDTMVKKGSMILCSIGG